jgi:hypothetical protein
MESVYEQFFFLQYSGNWSFIEAYNLPVGLRTWFMKRLVQQLEQEKEAVEKASSGSGGSSETHELSRFNQPKPPAKL